MSALVEARLVDGAAELDLLSDLVLLSSFEVGSPEIRAVTNGRPGRDGMSDETQHLGDALAAISGEFWGDEETAPAQLKDTLLRFCHPARSPKLVYRFDGTEERTATLRADPYAMPQTVETQDIVVWQASWRIPAGVSHGALRTVTANPGLGESGRVYPRTYPRIYPASTGNGTVLIDNPGSAPSHPLVRVYGPATGPRIKNNTTGLALEFTAALEVAAGDFVELDFAECTVRMNGLADVGSNRRYTLDFGASAWWSLQPGVNEVVYYPLTSTVPGVAEITYAPAYV